MSQKSQHILQRVAEFIEKNELLPPQLEPLAPSSARAQRSEQPLEPLKPLEPFEPFEPFKPLFPPTYVALSGGPDSVALHFDTFAYMEQHHLSVEMAARELRYNWWSDLTPIALGHHQDDSIETMLMNLMRGTGIHGMTGIVARHEAKHIIRPLLCLSRQDIVDYLSDNGLTYVIDSTNAENETLRNQIRNQLLPLMEQMVPQVRQGIARTMEHLQGTEWFADRYLGLFEALTEHHSQWGIEWDELNIAKAAQQFPKHLEDYLHEWTAEHTIPSRTQVVRTPKLLYTMPFDEQELVSHRPQLTFEEKTSPIPSRCADGGKATALPHWG